MNKLTDHITGTHLKTLRDRLNNAIRVMREVAGTEALNGRLVDMSGFGRQPIDEDNHAAYGNIKHGKFNVCGVVACAAGWCALDPQARKAFGLPRIEAPREVTLAEWFAEKLDRSFTVAGDDGGKFGFRTTLGFDDALGVDMGRLFGDDSSIHALRRELGAPVLGETDAYVVADVDAEGWLDTATRVRNRLNRRLSRERGHA